MAGAKRVCVIGAGPCGLTAAKNALLAGFEVSLFEKSGVIGGNWAFSPEPGHSSVYENTFLISSRDWSGFEDFPMPADYPVYPGHRALRAYFESYANHFGVTPHIRFHAEVVKAAPNADGGWRVAWRDASGASREEDFDALMVANGHHWAPRFPEIPGEFSGLTLHSHDFKRLDESWRGKNLLVVGGGNSACDVAVEAARIAGKVCLSMRSPQWFFPKFIFGVPADAFAASVPQWIPASLRQQSVKRLLRLLQGNTSRYGLPENTSPPLAGHPTLNSDLIDFIRHGRILPRPGIARLAGGEVEFVDGAREAFDILCFATGYWIRLPFFDPALVDFSDGRRPALWRQIMHPTLRNLYFIGLIQASGCVWPLADHQARLACMDLLARYRRPADIDAAIADEIAHPHLAYDPGPRHALEVDYHRYRRTLRGDLKSAGVDIGAPPARRKDRGRRAAPLAREGI